MASNRIKGITIEIDGNTTKLQESLKDVNKNLRDTESQLRDVDKLLKLDPKNMELLAQKQELLGRATDQTAEKLKKLREAQEQMKAAGVDEMSDDYMKVEREIQDCEQQQRKFTDAAKSTDEQIVKIGSGYDKVADKAKKASDATAGISKAAAAGIAGMAGLAVKSAENADNVNTLAKQTQLSTDTIQKMQYAEELLDVPFETAVKAVAKLKKGLDKNEDTLKSMNVAIRDQSGNYRDIESIFFDVLQGLSQIENETERDKIAMDLFGKSADELAGYIDDGGQAYRELSQMAEESGAIISQEDLDKANAFNDELDKLKATVGADLLKAGADIGTALLPVLQTVVEIISKITGAFANLGPTGQTVVMVLLGLLAALSPLLGLISKVAAIIPIISAALPAISGALSGVAAVISGPVLLAIGAVVAAIAVWVTNWENIKAGFIAFGEIVANTWTIAVNTVKSLILDIQTAFTNFKNEISMRWDEIKTKITTTIDTIKEKIEGFKAKIKEIWETIKGILRGELPTPKLKLPHIKITGGWSWNPPKAPSFGVQWYQKAMDEAYIMNSPTIFGAQNGQLLGGGEAGSETIVGTEKLMDMMSQVVGNQNVTVVLQGDAAEVFRLVRTENQNFFKANGYSPLTV